MIEKEIENRDELLSIGESLLLHAESTAYIAIFLTYFGLKEERGSDHWMNIAFAWRRLDRLRRMLGDEAIDKIIGKITQAISDSMGKNGWPPLEDWDKFLCLISGGKDDFGQVYRFSHPAHDPVGPWC